MAATRKLQAEIERCLKKVTEGVVDFEEIWNKLHSSTGNVSKFQEDLKREIKKLQRYRDQIRSWLLSDEIKDKSILVENRKLIETQMERFKLNEREAKKKMFSKEGLVSQTFDPIQKERDDVLNWLTASIDSLNVQFDQFECEVELLSLKKKLSNYEIDRKNKLKTRMEKHAFHIKKLETLLRMLDNMSVEVSKIINLQDNVNYYIEFCEQPEFEDDDFLYDDIEGLDEIDLFGLDVPSPRLMESVCSTLTPAKASDVSDNFSPRDVLINVFETDDGKKLTPGSKQKATTPTAASRLSTGRISQTLPLQSQQSTMLPAAAPSVIWEVLTECSSASSLSALLPTFASVAANSNKQVMQPTDNMEPSLAVSTKKLPALLELCVEPPYTLGRSSTTQRLEKDTFVSEQQDIPDLQNMQQEFYRQDKDLVSDSTLEEECELSTSSASSKNVSSSLPISHISTESHMMLSPTNVPCITQEYNNYLASLQANQTMATTPDTFCEFLPPIPILVPSYYPQRKEEFLKTSTEEFFEKLSVQVLFFMFYYSPGSEAQLQSARALKKRHWRFHKGLHTWFIRAEQSTELTETYERGKFIFFDYSVWDFENSPNEEFIFEFKYLEAEDLDILLALNLAQD